MGPSFPPPRMRRNALFNSLLTCAERRPPRPDRSNTLLPPPPKDDHLRASFERALVEDKLAVNAIFTLNVRGAPQRDSKTRRRCPNAVVTGGPHANHTHRLRSTKAQLAHLDIIPTAVPQAARIDAEDAIQIDRKRFARLPRRPPLRRAPHPVSVGSTSEADSYVDSCRERLVRPFNQSTGVVIELDKDAPCSPSTAFQRRPRARVDSLSAIEGPGIEAECGRVPHPVDPEADHGRERSPRSKRVSKTVARPVKRLSDTLDAGDGDDTLAKNTAPQLDAQATSGAAEAGQFVEGYSGATDSKETRLSFEATKDMSASTTSGEASQLPVVFLESQNKPSKGAPLAKDTKIQQNATLAGDILSTFHWTTPLPLPLMPTEACERVASLKRSSSQTPLPLSSPLWVVQRKQPADSLHQDSEPAAHHAVAGTEHNAEIGRPLKRKRRIDVDHGIASDAAVIETREDLEISVGPEPEVHRRRSHRTRKPLASHVPALEPETCNTPAAREVNGRSAKPLPTTAQHASDAAVVAARVAVPPPETSKKPAQSPVTARRIRRGSVSSTTLQTKFPSSGKERRTVSHEKWPAAASNHRQFCNRLTPVRSKDPSVIPPLTSKKAGGPLISSSQLPLFASGENLKLPAPPLLHRSKAGMFGTGLPKAKCLLLESLLNTRQRGRDSQSSVPSKLKASRQTNTETEGGRTARLFEEVANSLPATATGNTEAQATVKKSVMRSIKLRLPLSAGGVRKLCQASSTISQLIRAGTGVHSADAGKQNEDSGISLKSGQDIFSTCEGMRKTSKAALGDEALGRQIAKREIGPSCLRLDAALDAKACQSRTYNQGSWDADKLVVSQGLARSGRIQRRSSRRRGPDCSEEAELDAHKRGRSGTVGRSETGDPPARHSQEIIDLCGPALSTPKLQPGDDLDIEIIDIAEDDTSEAMTKAWPSCCEKVNSPLDPEVKVRNSPTKRCRLSPALGGDSAGAPGLVAQDAELNRPVEVCVGRIEDVDDSEFLNVSALRQSSERQGQDPGAYAPVSRKRKRTSTPAKSNFGFDEGRRAVGRMQGIARDEQTVASPSRSIVMLLDSDDDDELLSVVMQRRKMRQEFKPCPELLDEVMQSAGIASAQDSGTGSGFAAVSKLPTPRSPSDKPCSGGSSMCERTVASTPSSFGGSQPEGGVSWLARSGAKTTKRLPLEKESAVVVDEAELIDRSKRCEDIGATGDGGAKGIGVELSKPIRKSEVASATCDEGPYKDGTGDEDMLATFLSQGWAAFGDCLSPAVSRKEGKKDAEVAVATQALDAVGLSIVDRVGL